MVENSPRAEGVRGIRLGTRGSRLALAQAEWVAGRLQKVTGGRPVEVIVIKTTGDERMDVDILRLTGMSKGLFTKELEVALMEGRIDVAVHSLKDLPVELPEGLVLGAVTERAEAFDVLISKHEGGLAGLPAGALVGTSSMRRRAILGYLRPDLRVVGLRGNVPTRLRRLAEDRELDAVVLAKAGLDRLGWDVVPDGLRVTVEEEILPAPGQGALGLECRGDDEVMRKILREVHHEETARCVSAERALLGAMGGGCACPLGAYARWCGGRVVMRAIWFSEPGEGGEGHV